MWTIKQFVCNPLEENCYVVSDDTHECIIIDCGAWYPEEHAALRNYIRQQKLKPVHLVATHGHLDHNFGNAMLYQEYGLKAEVCNEDAHMTGHLAEQASSLYGIDLEKEQQQAPLGRLLTDGDVINFGNHSLKVIQTPGHTRGSALLYCAEEHTAFTGDTLFRMSIGRTDLDGGNWNQMQQSLHNVIAHLPQDTIVLSGHGPQSTIGDELKYNPYLRD